MRANAECSRAGPIATKNGRGVRPASAGTTGYAWFIPIKPRLPDRYHEARLGANVRINALTVWRVFQAAMPWLHATSTAKSISGAMHTTLCDIPCLPPCQRLRPVSPGWVTFAQLDVLINHPAR